MKQKIFYELLGQLKQKPDLMRKLKTWAIIGVFGLIIITGLTFWAGISAIGYITSSANQTVQSLIGPTNADEQSNTHTESYIESFKTNQMTALHQLLSEKCWNKAKSLLNIQAWLESPALLILENLQISCINQTTEKGSVL